jgi:hypothetical protein
MQPEEAIQTLGRTPGVLRRLLEGLPDSLVAADEGPDTWSPFDVVGHLIHGERTDWIARMHRILEHGDSEPFGPFDRFAMFRESKGKSMDDLLGEFETLRAPNLDDLAAAALKPADLERRGLHPALGTVTLGQLLATWVVHDLSHLAQIARVLAKQHAEAVGPWKEYLPILAPRNGPDSSGVGPA